VRRPPPHYGRDTRLGRNQKKIHVNNLPYSGISYNNNQNFRNASTFKETSSEEVITVTKHGNGRKIEEIRKEGGERGGAWGARK